MSYNKDLFNLKLTDIPGNNSYEILKKYIFELEKFLKISNLDENSKSLYLAYLRGLEYYKYVSNPNGKVLKNSLKLVNEQYKILSKKYKNLQVEGRIKSVLSSDEKIKNKICEYIKDGRDLSKLNFSLKDFIAFRFILSENKFTNEKIETQKCYKLLADHIKITKSQGFTPILVRPERIDAIRKRQTYYQNPKDAGIYIPKKKSVFFKKEFVSFVKDYIRYPKKSLYQSLHYCVSLPNSNFYVYPTSIEFQFRTQNMHNHSEHGISSHDNIYKRNNFFNILDVPIFIKPNSNNDLECLDFDKNLAIKYAQFEKIYNIPYKLFKKVFSYKEQCQILSGTHIPKLNEDTYHWETCELKYLPWLDFKKYKINHTEAQKKFKQALEKDCYFQK
jgi:hypothetical protein